jgi:exopolysaccharide production protein ExoZ
VNWKDLAARLDAAFGVESHRDRITTVEGARGVAMSLVFLIHLLEFFCRTAPQNGVDSRAIWLIYPVGNLAGVFFVVLTGCFLYQSLLKAPVNYFEFLRRRLTRIYSVFGVMLALYLILSVVFPKESKLPHEPAAAVLLVIENLLLLPGVFQLTSIITVSWTLSCVVLCCLILPPIVEFTGMRKWLPIRRVEFFFTAAVLILAIGNATGWFALRLVFIPVGALVWEALAWRKANLDTARWLEPAALGAVALTLGLKYWFVVLDGVRIYDCALGLRQAMDGSLCLFCLGFALFSVNSTFSKVLVRRPLRWLGNMSFSYYLSHSLVIKFLTLFPLAVAWVIRTPIGFWGAVAVSYALSMIPAVALFFLVEKPSLAKTAVTRQAEAPAAFAEAA